jgi:hypothetical protein
MKKEELKASLDKIQPREELVNLTLARIHEQKARENRRDWFTSSTIYGKGLRLAGAACAFVLVFSIGFTAARLGLDDPTAPPTPDVRLAGTLDTDQVGNNYDANVASYALMDAEEWIVVRGNTASIQFIDLTEEQSAMGAIAGGRGTISVESIEGRSNEFSRSTISTELVADVLFYDTDSLNLLVNAAETDLLIRLIPTEGESWEIHDFYLAE